MTNIPYLYHFTGAWAFFPKNIVINDVSFCKNFFGNPERTNFGMKENGFSIYIEFPENPLNNEAVIINNQQLFIATPKLNKIQQYLDTIHNKILEINSTEFSFAFLAYSFTLDSEIENDSNFERGGDLIAAKFINKNTQAPFEYTSFGATDISVEFVDENKKNRYSIQLQPRLSNLKNIFLRLNNTIISQNNNATILTNIPTQYEELTRLSNEWVKNFN